MSAPALAHTLTTTEKHPGQCEGDEHTVFVAEDHDQDGRPEGYERPADGGEHEDNLSPNPVAEVTAQELGEGVTPEEG